MKKIADQLQRESQTPLDLALDLCRHGLGCCEKLADINTTTARRMIAQVDGNRDALLRAETAECAVAGGRIALAYWASTFSCGLEYQRRIVAGLSQASFRHFT